MKKALLATITLLMTTTISINTYDNNDYRPHTFPGRTVDATGNVVTGTGNTVKTVGEGAAGLCEWRVSSSSTALESSYMTR